MDALNAKTITTTVKDPLYRDISATYAYAPYQKVAIIEMAAASGLDLLTNEERNPLKTTSFGTGQLINHALDQGAQKLYLVLVAALRMMAAQACYKH